MVDQPTTISRVGAMRVHTSHPKGFVSRDELAHELNPDFNTARYYSPSYNDDVNLRVFRRYEGTGSGTLDPNRLRKAAAIVYQHFSPFMTAPPATHEEVVAEMVNSSSPGVPFKDFHPTKGAWFENFGYTWLKGAYDHFVNVEPWQPVYLHFLKEEIRKVGKDPHGILAGPLDLQYIAMRLFLHQNHGLYDNNLRCWSAIGMARDGLDWHRLWLRLSRFKTGGCSDITEMDAHMLAEVMDEICKMRQAFYIGPNRAKVHAAIRALYDSYIDSVCLVNNELWQKAHGLPTGIFNTSTDNTLAMAIYMVYCIITQHPDWGLTQIIEHVSMVLYGDDNDYTHDENCPELRPEELFPIMAASFNLEVKSPGSQHPKDFDFLSAFFKPVQSAGSTIMVPLFNTDRLAAHVAWGPRNWTEFTEFQRIAMIRQVGIWDDKFCDTLETWLAQHRSTVTPEEFSALVPSREVLRNSYLVPRCHENIIIPQAQSVKGALNGPAPLKQNIFMSDRGTWSRSIEAKLDGAGCTQTGKDYLLMALDPFPDTEHPLVGLPDGSSGRSVVQQYNQILTVSAPPGLAAGNTWDLHVAFIPELFDPVLNTQLAYNGTATYGSALTQDDSQTLGIVAQTFPFRAPICCVAVPSGSPTFPSTGTTTPFNPATMSIQGFNLTGYVGPQSRVVAGGVECENTTPELNISGGVTYYTTPGETVASTTAVLDSSSGTNYPGIRTVQITRSPPATVALAQSIPSSVRRKAKEGAYIQFRPSKGQPNPPIEPVRNSRVFQSAGTLAGNATVTIAGFCGTPSGWHTVGAFTPVPQLPFSQSVPFDLSGAYFTGLSSQSTIDVTLRLYIETFPSQTAQTLVSVTNPTPVLDECAMEIFSKVSATLPPGCEVKYNANGGWFKGIMNKVAAYAPTIGSALGTIVPGAGLIGKGLGGVAELLSGMKLGEKAQKEVDTRRERIQRDLTPGGRTMVRLSGNARTAPAANQTVSDKGKGKARPKPQSSKKMASEIQKAKALLASLEG